MAAFRKDWDLLVSTRSWLSEVGYRLIESRGPEGMDQGLHAYEGDHLEIRIVADRGQWFVEARPRAAPTWFTLEPWSVCIGAPVLFHVAPAIRTDEEQLKALSASWKLAPQVEYLRAHLVDLEQACDAIAISRTMDCLNESAP
jgi:hypothetical protein